MKTLIRFWIFCLFPLFLLPSRGNAQWNIIDKVKNAQGDGTTIYYSNREGRNLPKKKVNNIPLAKSLLWEISGNGLTRPSYLFGTIHMICEDDYLWTPYMQRALEQTDELVLEIDMNEVEKEYGNVYGTLGEEDEESREANITNESNFIDSDGDSNMPNGSHNRQKTMQNTIIDRIQNRSNKSKPFKNKPDGAYSGSTRIEGCDKMLSYEGKLAIMARARNMKLSGLETIEEQLSIDDDVPDQYERNGNKKFSKIEDTDPLLYLSKVYLTQDLNALLDLLLLPGYGITNLDNYLFNRNENWVRKLPQMMKASPKFIAVGAGHLPGDKGVINLLRKKGYTVKPVLK